MRQDFPRFDPGDPATATRPATRAVNASYRALRRTRQAGAFETTGVPDQSGPGEWFAPLLPPDGDQPASATPDAAALIARCAVGMVVAGVVLAVGGLANPRLLAAGGLLLVGALLAVALNRASEPGWAAGALVVASTLAPLAVALLSTPGDAAQAFALDALVAPVLLAGLLLSPRTPLVVGAVSVLATVLVLLPHQFGGDSTPLLRESLLSKTLLEPIGLIVLVALIAWLWGSAMERALTSTAATAAAAARYSSLDEQQAHLDRGIQTLLNTLAQVANGQLGARVDGGTRTVLWPLTTPLNALIARLTATAQADQKLRATEHAIDQLIMALEQARSGRTPVWPSASGTRIARLIGMLTATTPRLLPMPATGAGGTPLATAGHSSVTGRPASDPTPPALPQHRAPDAFLGNQFAQSYPAGAPATNGHAAARHGERQWASHPLPPLDTGAIGGGLRSIGQRPPARPARPSWPLSAASAPDEPQWEPSAPTTPSWDVRKAPLIAPAPATEPAAPAATRQTAPELEWSSTGPVLAAPGAVPPSQSWTIVPVVPEQVERPEWPDFLITLDATRRGQDGRQDDG